MNDKLNIVINKFKEKISGFEIRNEQLEMIENTYEAMLNNLKAGIHAPTGTGKSLAYLIAFLAVKLDNPSFKITISTFTISLQEQLKKDLDLANEIYVELLNELHMEETPLKYVIMKGKNNYFCTKRFNNAKEDSEIPSVTVSQVEQQTRRIMKSNGNLDKQNFDYRFSTDEWDKIQVEKCMGQACPFKNSCTYFEHYYAEVVDIYITNHSLFLKRHYYVGEWKVDFNIFDEAHKLERVLIDSNTFDLSLEVIERWVRIGSNILYKYNAPAEEANAWIQKFLYKHPSITNFRNGSKVIMQRAIEVAGDRIGKNNETAISYEKLGYNDSGFKKLIIDLEEWQQEMLDSVSIESINSFESESESENVEIDEDKFNNDKASWMSNLSELKVFNELLNNSKNPGILWVETNKYKQFSFKVSPKNVVDITPPFVKGTLLTSGTLAQENSCSLSASRLSVTLDIDKVLPTPFKLNEQTLVYASKNINPNEQSTYEKRMEEEIWELLVQGNLKTFILFTSNVVMEKMYNKLYDRIISLANDRNEDVEVWIQDDSNHKKVIESFFDIQKKTVLFGVLTYFEGIDLKGDALTQIILTKLPYAVPTHPLQEILDEKFKKSSRNTKMNYSQWEAIVRFEQAFGRLIRTFNDYGTFSILDNRVYKNTRFLEMFKAEGITITDNINDIKDFYDKHQ